MSASIENEPYTTMSLEETKQTALWKVIQRKLKEREQQSNARYFLDVLARLADEKQRPSPDEQITNPLAEYYNQNKSDKQNVAAKRMAYNRALDAGAVAYTGFKQSVPLGVPGAEFNNVEFIGGLWRVQKKFSYEITDVRDRQFVLVQKLPRNEKNKFEYYTAATTVWNCSGCSADVTHPDWIVAKYETPRGTYWSYGRTIEQARAFLAISIYDAYQDLIHAVAFDESNQK